MGKYTKFFNKESEYNSFRNTSKYILPNVSYTDDTETVHFNPKVSIPKVALATLHYNATADNLLALNRANNISVLRIDGVNIEISPAVEGEKTYDIDGSQIVITDYNNFFIECPVTYFITDVVSEMRFKTKDSNAIPAYASIIAMDSGIMMAQPVPIEYLEAMDITFDSDTNEFVVGEDILGEMNISIIDGFHFNFALMDANMMFLDTEVYTKTTTGGLELPYYFTSEGEHVVEIETESGIFGGANMFAGSTLYSVKFNEAITMVEDYTFMDCTNLPVINNIRYADTYLVEAVDKTMSSYVMKSTTKWIGSNAFSGCTNWTDSLVIPNTVVSIGSNAFAYCTGLTDNLLIPYNVSYIGSYAFHNCTGLTGNLVLPRYITSINDYTFSGCYSLTGNLIIPSSVTSIKYGAFSGCRGLTGELVIPNSVIGIGGDAFFNCTGLTSLSLGSGLTEIGNYAFQQCKRLTEIVIFAEIAPTINSYTFNGIGQGGMLYYPDGSDYSSWLSTDSYYLGYYGWNQNEGTISCTYNVTDTTSATRLCSYATGFTDIVIDGVSIGGGSTGYTFSTTGEHTVEFKTKISSIGYNTFRDCTGLTSIVIPDSVRSIGDSAFSGCTGLTSLVIPDSVRSIGSYAFKGCYDLTSLSLGSGLTTIGGYAFYNCSGLTGSLVLPDSVTSIGNYAFYFCKSLTSLVIPNSVTSIGSYTFGYCYDLTSVSLGSGLTSIGSSAFTYCTGLTDELVIPDSVTSIERGTFERCYSLTSVSLGSGLTEIKDNYAFGYCSGLTSVSFSSNLLHIGYSAFYDCYGLTSIVIPESVTSIGGYAFYFCSSLTSIVIPDSVIKIGTHAFYGCSSLPIIDNMRLADGYLVEVLDKKQSIYALNNNIRWIGSYAFHNCTGLTSVLLPDSLIGITDEAFVNCTGLTSIDIPDSVRCIGNSAFGYCSGLTSITLPKSLKIVGQQMLTGCTSLACELVMPDSVTSIGYAAFANCTGLTGELVIPDSVTEIGSNAFENCTGLTGDLVISDSVTFIGWLPFAGVNLNSIVVSSGNSVYDSRNNCNCIIEKSSNKLIQGCKNSVIPNTVNEIYIGAFYNCYGLTSIVIPNSVTKIGDSAFKGCTGLTSLVIPNTVTTIYENAFDSCYGLTSLTLGSGLTSIGPAAFTYCTGLTSIVIPDSVTSISNGAFGGNNLNSIVVSAGNSVYDSRNNCNCIIKTSDNTLIQGCKNSVIPDSVPNIGNGAFTSCYGLTSLVLPDSVTSIGNYAFRYCYDLTSLVIPDSVTSISYQAFSGCTGLTEITLGRGLISIGESAFRGCTSLSAITSYAVTAPRLQYDAFRNVSVFGVLTYPEGSDYSQWLSTGSYYLGSYGWNKDELPIITCTYNVTDTTSPTKLWYYSWSYGSFASVIVDGTRLESGNGGTGYTFSTTGEHTVEFIMTGDTILEQAFYRCYALKSVDIPDSVTEIRAGAFSGCSGLTNITCHAVNAPLLGSGGVFYDVKQNGTLYYPSGSNYSTWLSTDSYYLGYYNWTGQTI